jgi:glutamate racemase
MIWCGSLHHPQPPPMSAISPSAISLSAISRDLPIGIFDSGIGGLTVAASLRRHLPAERLLYLGDVARLPYGTKSPSTVVRYAEQAARFLVGRGIKLLVIACNTASAHALAVLTEALAPLPVLGVVDAGAAAAARQSSTGGIVVIATEGTTRSGVFPRTITALRPDARVSQIACPLFVSLAEEGLTEGPIAEAMIRETLAAYFAPDQGNDALLLGCTHFPLLIPALQSVLGSAPPHLVDCGEAIALIAKDLLTAHSLTAPTGPGGITLFTTEGAPRFARMAQRLLPDLGGCPEVELVDL